MKDRIVRQLSSTVTLVTVLCFGGLRGLAVPSATTTTMAISSGESTVTSVVSGTVVTLSATVLVGTSAVTAGQVKFCDASAAYCTDIHILGTEQLTSDGTATLKYVPGIGSHSYKAVFVGSAANAPSTSDPSALTVIGLFPTTTTLVQTGTSGNYSLTASVAGTTGLTAPTGTASFIDTSNANAILGTATLGLSTHSLNFLASPIPAAGAYPEAIVAADFNGDGVPDLAIANAGNGTVTIYLGKPDGTFTEAANSPISVGEYPWSIVAGDFNGDGVHDLAVANYGNSSVSILLGKGDGTFTIASPLAIGGPPTSLAVGDFNEDGNLDLALTDSGTSSVVIFLGNGDGTFSQATDSSASLPYAYRLAVGDFNGDGVQDLAVNVSGHGYVAIFLGQGDGTFTNVGQVWVGTCPSSVVVGDFNGDGVPDLAVVNYGDGTIEIHLGAGDGTFGAAISTMPVGINPMYATVGDFNGDGIPDLAVADYGSDTVTVLLGNGDGSFIEAPARPLAVDYEPISIAVADFNGDGFSDLAVANEGDSTVDVMQSQLVQTVQATISNLSLIGLQNHLVKVSYPGDESYNPSISGAVELSVQPVTPAVLVSPSSSNLTTTQDLSVTISVRGGNGAPTPTGTITLGSGGYSSPATPLNDGTVTVDIPAGSLALGSDTLTASYTPDSSSSTTYSSGSGSASVAITLPTAVPPVVTVTPSSSSITMTQGLTVTVAVSGGSGNPAPTGMVTLTSSIPALGSSPVVYDTFQYSDGTLINGRTSQSGNSAWRLLSNGIGVVEDTHLINNAPSGAPGLMYASLANSSTVGGATSPVTTIGGTIRMCPSSSGTYDPSYTAVGLIASHASEFYNQLELGFGPASWWLQKRVNGVATWLAWGSEDVAVDCKTDYTVEMLIDEAAGTVQVIPPNGIPTAVISDPDILGIDPRYGTWEPENNAPNKYIGKWGSVWMGGGYTTPAAILSAGTATINIRAGSLALGSGVLTATFTPDSSSSANYTVSTGISANLTVAKATPAVTVTPSSTSITAAQRLTVTVALTGSTLTPSGTVTLTSGSYTSPATTLNAGTATINLPAGALTAGSAVLTASYSPDLSSSPSYNNATGTSSSISVSKATPTVTVTPSATSIATTQGLTVSVSVSGGSGAPIATGTVTVTGGNYASAATALSAGSATVNVPAGSFSLGSTVLNASFTPDSASSPVYTSAMGASSSVNVAETVPTVTVAPSASSISTLQALTVTVKVSGGSGASTPTGTVTLASGSYTSTSTALNAGAATINIPGGSLAAGSNVLTARFTPDSASSTTYTSASATSPIVIVNKATPGVSVTPSASSITAAQVLTVTVAVSSGAGAPTPSGAVTVTSGSYTSAATTLSAGVATVGIPAWALAVGSDNLMASYSPDSSSTPIYNGSASTSFNVTVNKATPSVTVTPSLSGITKTQGLNVAVTVSGGSGAPMATGNVIVSSGSYTSAPTTLSAGSATIDVAAGSLATGSSSLSAYYIPDSSSLSSYTSASGTSSVITVGKATPEVIVTLSSSNITTVQGLTVTIVVSGGSGAPTPTGTITVTGSGYTSSSTMLSAGSAVIGIPAGALAAGSDTLTASYSADASSSATYNGSTGTSPTVTVAKATPAVTVIASSSSISTTQGLTITVVVSGGNNARVPTGTASVTNGGYTSTATVLDTGSASIIVPARSLANGSNTLTAVYSGDAAYNTSAGSTAVTVTDIAITLGDVSEVSPGTTATATATIQADNSYTGTMMLTCALISSPGNAKGLPTCSLTPTSVEIVSGQGGSTVVTVHTTNSAITAGTQAAALNLRTLGGGGGAIAGLLIFGLLPRRRRWLWMLLFICLIAPAGIIGCGGAGNQGFVPTGASNPATTKGIYTFTVTGTDSINPAITASTDFSITVQ